MHSIWNFTNATISYLLRINKQAAKLARACHGWPSHAELAWTAAQPGPATTWPKRGFGERSLPKGYGGLEKFQSLQPGVGEEALLVQI